MLKTVFSVLILNCQNKVQELIQVRGILSAPEKTLRKQENSLMTSFSLEMCFCAPPRCSREECIYFSYCDSYHVEDKLSDVLNKVDC